MEAPPLHHAAPPSPLYPPSVDSSPRSRHNDPWDAAEPAPKLRLMCSYGGHIVPRPHDKSLCYIGGDTRIIVIDRHITLSDLHHRLSKSILCNEPFSVKYQLPTEDLDSLISVSTDEDLENMVEEYDRLSNSGAAPGRIRLFIFPKSFSGIDQLLVETASIKSEDWFFDTLNGKVSLSVDREFFSETSSVNCLLGLDDDSVTKAVVVEKDVEAQDEASKIVGNGNDGNRNQDVHSVPDSPLLETTSSFGSVSSSPFVANLPPIRVRVEENPKIGGSLGIEEQFQQMNIGVGVAGIVNQPPSQAVVAGFPATVGSEYSNKVISDDERSDHGGYRKVQQIQPQVQHDQMLHPQQILLQYQQKQTNAFDLPSPDSVSSEGSVTNSLSRQRQAMYHQDPLMQFHTGNSRNVSSNQVDLNTDDQNKTKVQMHMQAEESGYLFSGQLDQNRAHMHQSQQFVHPGNQYIPAGAVPIASYYPMIRSQQQQHHPVIDPQYHQIYLMSARQNQAYNLPGPHQPSSGELAPNAPSRTQMPPVSVATQPAYCQPRNIPSSKPEMTGDIYRTASPQLVQMPSSHHQAQYVGYAQVRQPSQSMTPSSSANSSYSYEVADTAANAQMYYTPFPPQLAAQYQTLTTSPGMAIHDGSAHLPAEGIKHQAGNSMP